MERDGLWGSSDEDGDNLAQFMAGSGDNWEMCAVSCCPVILGGLISARHCKDSS